jgi:hypothetical protein
VDSDETTTILKNHCVGFCTRRWGHVGVLLCFRTRSGRSALGIALLLLQTLVFLAISGGLVLAAGGAALYATQQRRSSAA